jgi:hypothetical protein
MISHDEPAAQRDARIEVELRALMARHNVAQLCMLPTGRAKRASERLGREAPNVYVRLMFAERPTHNEQRIVLATVGLRCGWPSVRRRSARGICCQSHPDVTAGAHCPETRARSHLPQLG